MKPVYINNKYKVYNIDILGYKMQLHETEKSGYSISVPMGEGQDKKMFDSLVYYNKGVYHDIDKNKVIQKVKEFIENYKNNIK